MFINILAEENSSDFSLLSYNVLSQRLLEKYSHFYDWSDESVLKWNYRKTILLNEIRQFNADVSIVIYYHIVNIFSTDIIVYFFTIYLSPSIDFKQL